MTIMLGVSPPGGDTIAGARAFEAAAGKHAAILNYWEETDPAHPWGLQQAAKLAGIRLHHGAVPMITWEPAPWGQNGVLSGSPYALSAFASGQYDALLASYADGIKAYGGPVLLRWGHELNGGWYSWGAGANGNTDDFYVTAWRRLVGIFRARGASNAQWVWCPNVDDNGYRPFEDYFPGDDVVDWVALDGYNWAGVGGGPAWLSLDAVLDQHDSYRRLLGLSARPILLGEWGCNEPAVPDGGVSKAAWFTDALAALPRRERLQAAVYFNAAADAAHWPIDSSPPAAAAFRAAAASTTYTGAGQ